MTSMRNRWAMSLFTHPQVVPNFILLTYLPKEDTLKNISTVDWPSRFFPLRRRSMGSISCL